MTYQLLDFIDLEDTPFGEDLIFNLGVKMMDFHRNVTLDFDYPQEAKEKLLKARTSLDIMRLIIKQELEPEENKYIRKVKKSWDWMIDNSARFDKRLDQKESETFKLLEREIGMAKTMRSEQYSVNTDHIINTSASSYLISYRRELVEAAEHIVYYPLKNSHKRFLLLPLKDENGFMIVKDKKLFSYLIFVHLFHAYQTLGGLAREENPRSVKNTITTNLSTSGNGVESLIPPNTPEEVETEIKNEAAKEAAEQYFNTNSALFNEDADV